MRMNTHNTNTDIHERDDEMLERVYVSRYCQGGVDGIEELPSTMRKITAN